MNKKLKTPAEKRHDLKQKAVFISLCLAVSAMCIAVMWYNAHEKPKQAVEPSVWEDMINGEKR